jgi:hypothetical protein
MSVPGKNLPQARGRLAAVSSSSYGYFGGGYTPTAVSTIERLDFSTDSITLPGKNLPQGKQSLAAVSSGFYGYFGGGSNPSAVLSCTINRLDFSTEIVSSPVVSPGQLTQARRDLAGTSNAGYGYFGGGSASVPTPAIFNTIDRLDFSTEIITAPGKNLSQERDSLAATSSSSYGYFGGGENISSTNVSTIERLDFSTETLNTITSSGISGISPGRRELSAVASASYGWFGGGFQNQCTINRLDFSTELTIRTGYNLSQGRSYLTGIQAN